MPEPLLDADAIWGLLLEALWPRCSFETPDEAAVAYRAAYPHEEPDPHLADWLATII